MSQTPFPTVFEIIRFIATGFDTKASNKQLDDLARDVFADYRQVELMLEQVLIKPLAKYVSSGFARSLSSGMQKLISDYLKSVSLRSVDGISREQALPVLVLHWFVSNSLKVLTGTLTQLPNMPSAFLLLGNTKPAIGNVLGWASDNIEGWTESISALPKEQKDQYSNWRKGKYLPDLQSLHLLVEEDVGEGVSLEVREKVMGLLILARAVDSFRSLPLGEAALDEARQQLMGAKPTGNLGKLFESYQQDARQRVESIWPHLGYLRNHLRRTTPKSEGVQSESRKCIDDLTCQLKALREYETSKHKLAQLEGRWHVFSGDLRLACKHYGLAVEAALYRAGNELNGILEEAFCVAAKANNSVLMRKVKNSQILFEVDLESVSQVQVGIPSKKIEEFLQSWEINAWAAEFDRKFPQVGFFKGVDARLEEQEKILGSLLYDFSKKVIPDYDSPNKKRKLDIHKLKAWPQVCWFILMNENGVVEKLIESGATMDIESSSGDTPLIMALENLVIPELPLRSLDDTALKLVLTGKDVEKTVNKQTHKKKLLPIIQAVGSGRPDVVKKIIDLGANVNQRGETDNQTALNMCVKWIGALKDPDAWAERQMQHPITPELLDSLRRTSNGVMGATLEQQHKFFSPDLTKMHQPLFEMYKCHIINNMALDNMREVLMLLLEAGADVNALMQSPLKGYTPLMLAIELDLDFETSLMLQYQADLDQSFYHPGISTPINSWDLARHHGANRVLKLLDDIRPYYVTKIPSK